MQNNSLQVLSKFAFKKKSLLFPSKTISSFSQGERGRGEGKGGHVEWYQYKLSETLHNELDELACEENKREGLILTYLGSHHLIQELLSFYLYDERVFGLGFREFGQSLHISIYDLSIPVPVYCFTKQLFKGLAFLHSMGCFHADINCNNILIYPLPNGNIKLQIIDFGRSCIDRSKHEKRYIESVESLSASCNMKFDMIPWLKESESLSEDHPLWEREHFMYNAPFRPPDLLLADLFLYIQNHNEKMQHYNTLVGYFCDVYACAMLVIQVMKPHFFEHHHCLDKNCTTLSTKGDTVNLNAIKTQMEEYIEKTIMTLKQNPFFKEEHLTKMLIKRQEQGIAISSRSIEVNRTILVRVITSLPQKFATVFPRYTTSMDTFFHYYSNLFEILETALDPNLGNRKSSLEIDTKLKTTCIQIRPIVTTPYGGEYITIKTKDECYAFYDDHLLIATSRPTPTSPPEEYSIDVYYILNINLNVLSKTVSRVYSAEKYRLQFYLQNGEYLS